MVSVRKRAHSKVVQGLEPVHLGNCLRRSTQDSAWQMRERIWREFGVRTYLTVLRKLVDVTSYQIYTWVYIVQNDSE